MDLRLEMVLLPVSDIDRAKEFYDRIGFVCDVDHETEEFRVVQFTPPGSQCSVAFGRGLGGVSQPPVVGLHLVVDDLEWALTNFQERNVNVGAPFHFGPEGKAPGIDPGRADYASYAEFSDPDGNVWLLQEVPSSSVRLRARMRPSAPGREFGEHLRDHPGRSRPDRSSSSR